MARFLIIAAIALSVFVPAIAGPPIARRSFSGDDAPPASFTLARWIPQSDRIEICASGPGDLYRLPSGASGWLVGWHPGECVAFPPEDALIDINYAPRPGDVWCVVSRQSTCPQCAIGSCSEPLPPNTTRYRTIIPLVLR